MKCAQVGDCAAACECSGSVSADAVTTTSNAVGPGISEATCDVRQKTHCASLPFSTWNECCDPLGFDHSLWM